MGKLFWERLQAATGMIYVLIALTALLIVSPPPAAGASAREIATFYTVHGTAFMVGGYVCIAGEIFYLWFIAYLRRVLGQAEGGVHQLSTLSFGAGVSVSTISFAVAGIGQTLPCLARDPSALSILKILSDIVDTGFTTIFIPAILLVGAASVVMLRTSILPRWVGILGLVIAVLQLFGSLSLAVMPGSFLTSGGPSTIVAYLSLLLWLVVVSGTLVVKVGSAEASARPLP